MAPVKKCACLTSLCMPAWSKLLMIMMLLMIKLVKVMAMSRVTKCTHLRPSGHPILGGTCLRYSSNQNWHPWNNWILCLSLLGEGFKQLLLLNRCVSIVSSANSVNIANSVLYRVGSLGSGATSITIFLSYWKSLSFLLFFYWIGSNVVFLSRTLHCLPTKGKELGICNKHPCIHQGFLLS